MNDGGPAFPCGTAEYIDGELKTTNPVYSGMTLRDWFAGQTLLVLAKAYAEGTIDDVTPPHLAWTAYQLADAMLAEREKSQ